MTPAQFWRCNPRKFNALCKVHADLNNPKPKSSQGDSPSPKGREITAIGQPDTFIDELMP